MRTVNESVYNPQQIGVFFRKLVALKQAALAKLGELGWPDTQSFSIQELSAAFTGIDIHTQVCDEAFEWIPRFLSFLFAIITGLIYRVRHVA